MIGTNPVAGTIDVEHERMKYTLVFDFAAIAFFERVAGISLTAMLLSIMRGDPMTSHLVWLVQAGLQRHHPGSDAELAQAMLIDPEVKRAMELAVDAAMPDPPKDKSGNGAGNVAGAPARKRSISGTTGSGKHSKRGSRSANSGKQRPASSG